MRVVVRYVEGAEVTSTAERWRALRSDGVDWVEVGDEGNSARIASKSMYWLRREGVYWITGGASFYEDVKAPEIVIAPDGTQSERAIRWVPDLEHADVKLGWWWPGTSEPEDR